MSCYTRHLADLLPDEPAPVDRYALDGAVRRVLGLEDAECPEVWAAAKRRRDDRAFASAVRAELKVGR